MKMKITKILQTNMVKIEIVYTLIVYKMNKNKDSQVIIQLISTVFEI